MRAYAARVGVITERATPLLGGIADLLIPRCCVVCERLLHHADAPMACDTCWARVVRPPHPQCHRCGHPVQEGSCRWCPLLPPFVRSARSWCWVPGGVAERLVYALKYEGWQRLGAEMAQRMARLSWPDDVVHERAAVIPVPLSSSRFRERGYNQSELLAVALARTWGIPHWNDVVQRPRATSSQTRLTPEQRLTNVANAFRVAARESSRMRDAHIVLVDDVVTTAATLNACATVLFDSGARVISYVTFGRARAPGDAPLTRGSAEHGH
ncbi:MAG: ComF family protein [Gemmatimonadaceae bacterium]